MFRRARYQKGSLQRVKRKQGPAVWIFRWYEVQADGRKAYRKTVIGTVEEYKTERDARQAVDALRITINQEAPAVTVPRITFETLVSHYVQNELPEDQTKAKVPKAHSTAVTYRRYLNKWIVPRWTGYALRDIQPIAVENWLFGLNAANGTKAKIRNIMSAVFRHAIRYGLLPRDADANPIRYVRQTAASEVLHTVLTADQVVNILANLREPCRTMAFLDAATGLRVSELLALQAARAVTPTRNSGTCQNERPAPFGCTGRPVVADGTEAFSLAFADLYVPVASARRRSMSSGSIRTAWRQYSRAAS